MFSIWCTVLCPGIKMKRWITPYILQTSGFLVRDWNETNTQFKSLTEVILPNVNKLFIFSTKDIISKNVLFEMQLDLSNGMNRRSWRPLLTWRKTMNTIFISVINQLDVQNFCFTISLFYASTYFEHMCSSSEGQNCITQPLVSSHL